MAESTIVMSGAGVTEAVLFFTAAHDTPHFVVPADLGIGELL